MAGKRTGLISGIAGFGQGLIEGYKTRKQLEEMAAERELKRKNFELGVEKAAAGETIIGPDGKTYRSEGIGEEAKGRLLGTQTSSFSGLIGAEDSVGKGRIKVMKPLAPEKPETNITETEFRTNPDKYRNVSGLKIVPDPKPKGLSLDQRAQLEMFKTAYKQYADTGQVATHLVAPLQEAMKNLDINLVPEEDQGAVYTIMQRLPSFARPEKKFTLGQGATSAGTEGPKPITKEIAQEYLIKANGDKTKARKLAAQDGYTF